MAWRLKKIIVNLIYKMNKINNYLIPHTQVFFFPFKVTHQNF